MMLTLRCLHHTKTGDINIIQHKAKNRISMTMVNYIGVSFNVYTFGDMQSNPQNAKKMLFTLNVVNKQTLKLIKALIKIKAKLYLRSYLIH